MPDDLLVRATINLAGLARGDVALVDSADTYIQGLLERRYLIPVSADGSHDTLITVTDEGAEAVQSIPRPQEPDDGEAEAAHS